MIELPLYCEIASEARSILWSFWWIPIIPFLSLCLVVWNLGLLWELKQESENNPSNPKEQLQERKRILKKGIVYASILPSMYLSFFFAGFFNTKTFWSNILWFRIYFVRFAISHS